MSDQQVIFRVFGGAALAAALALGFIFRESWLPKREPPTDPVRVAATPDPAPVVRPVATQPATRPSQPQKADGATGLLKRWAESLPKQPSQTGTVALSPATKPAPAKSAEPPKPPTIEEFERFAEAFVKEFGSDREAEFRAGHKNDKDRELGYGMSLVSTDIKKTESVAHPIVGVAKMQETNWVKSIDPDLIYFFSHGLAFEMHFAPIGGGKWKPVRVSVRITDQSVVPAELSRHRRSPIGDESEWSPKAVQRYADAAQK